MTHVIVIAAKSEELFSACRCAGVVPFFARDVRSGAARLRELGAGQVRGLLVDIREPDAPELLMDLRDEARFFSLPILALVAPSLGDAQRHAIWLGATDAVVATDLEGITTRLATMRSFDQGRPGSYRRTALVTHPDWTARRILGRAARRAGLDPVLVDDLEELRATLQLARLPVGALLFRVDDPRGTVELLERGLPTILVTEGVRRPSAVGTNTWVVPEDAVSEDLGFLLHEVLTEAPRGRRSSRRLLGSATCAFRAAGTRSSSHGVVHDVAADGMFLRTMAPLPEGLDVWVELRPDEASPWIHLRGVVVRRSRVGDGGVTPRGFAIRLARSECPKRDLEAWDAAYRRAADHGCCGSSGELSDDCPRGKG